MTAKLTIALLLTCCLASAQAATTAKKSEGACLAALEKASANGDGNASKSLAIYYGTNARNNAVAFGYLKYAIKAGVDVSDVPGKSIANIDDVCRNDPALRALVPAAEVPAIVAPAAAAKVVAAKAAKPEIEKGKPATPLASPEMHKPAKVATKTAESPKAGVNPAAPAVHAGEKAVLSVAEYERLAADLEWNGKIAEALPYWEKARDGGSRHAAKRIYQIYCFGAGDVDADYVKSIAAADKARKLGVDVPPLPRK